MNPLFTIHGVQYSLQNIKKKLLKLAPDRLCRLKDAFVGKSNKLELTWHNAILKENAQAFYYADLDQHIQSNISEETWNAL